MSLLVVVAASLPRAHPSGTVVDLITQVLAARPAAELADVEILCPSAVTLHPPLTERTTAYETAIGLETNQELWWPLLERSFDEILVYGTDHLADYQEVILACYLNAGKRSYVNREGARDLAEWRAQVKPDLQQQRPAVLRRLDPMVQAAYVQSVNRWLADQLARSNFDPPARLAERSPEALIYQQQPRLAVDLAEQAFDLERGPHGTGWSTLFCLDGFLVHTSDFFRALANFVMAVDGMESVLDVGCGSGLLSSHLGASGRYRSVLGIDAALTRVAGARTFAALNGSPTHFLPMSMADIRLPDRSVDLSVTSFALEQTGDHLDRCLAEIVRVTRKLIVLLEPTNEFFPTLASMWHVPLLGWANRYHAALTKLNLAYAVRPSLLSHYTNPGTIFVIDLESREHPRLRYPQLFGLGCEGWPGGVRIV